MSNDADKRFARHVGAVKTMYGQCAQCGGSLTADHRCPETGHGGHPVAKEYERCFMCGIALYDENRICGYCNDHMPESSATTKVEATMREFIHVSVIGRGDVPKDIRDGGLKVLRMFWPELAAPASDKPWDKTPRTDEEYVRNGERFPDGSVRRYYVKLEFARDLEREVSMLSAQLHDFRKTMAGGAEELQRMSAKLASYEQADAHKVREPNRDNLPDGVSI